MKKYITLFLSFCIGLVAMAQNQTVRGVLRDKESQTVIANAKVFFEGPITNPPASFEATTNTKGEFVFTEVPVGRYALAVEAKDYQIFSTNNIVVTSGKEVILSYELEQTIERVGEVTIKGKGKGDKPNNDAALISARLFTVDETDRFAGSRGDPARMASNFAGVQGADDSRNDIVVRGNSPQGILWRMEGIDIPNPNHFAIPGTTGGSVSIINNKILGNSDFFTGAFPAEYGNANAGAFDLKLRNGNNQKKEFSSQLGLLGWDALAEGNLGKKGGASYLVTYRYSTLAMFSKLNIPLGTDAVPNYQDYSFKLNFPLKNNKGNLSFFGIGGWSNIDINISKDTLSSAELYGDNDRDQLFASKMHIAGSSFQYNLNKNSYVKATVAMSSQNVTAEHRLVFRKVIGTEIIKGDTFQKYQNDSFKRNLSYEFDTKTIAAHAFYNKKFSAKSSMRAGLQLTQYRYMFDDSALNFNPTSPLYWKFSVRWNANGNAFMAIPYVQWKYKFSPAFTISTGVQMQSYTVQYDPNNTPLGNSVGGEKQSYTSNSGPLLRFGARYQLNKRDALNLGLGMHSQNQSAYVYYYQKPGNSSPHNLNMGLSKSNHAVLGWDHQMGKASRIKVETYYQQLSNLPVERLMASNGYKGSSFSLANTGSGFSRFFPDSLENTGIGKNYGIEFTIERFFSKGFYYLASLSVFDAQYQGSDKQWRSSDFNTDYAANGLIAKEFVFKNKNSLNIGGKVTFAGARRFSPMDTLNTIYEREYVENSALKNTQRFGSPYRRFDVRIAYRINAKKVSHEIAFDLVNVTNRKNVLKYSYIDTAPYARETYQLGFLPLFYYKLDFSL
ncbi:MAG: carboxypeptidase regulatory-like domain-containing protein [Bacteroidia bacterium]|nr:carboxypeptidase regulatory-like domain-containing protein [Bacteroidia bacterium]